MQEGVTQRPAKKRMDLSQVACNTWPATSPNWIASTASASDSSRSTTTWERWQSPVLHGDISQLFEAIVRHLGAAGLANRARPNRLPGCGGKAFRARPGFRIFIERGIERGIQAQAGFPDRSLSRQGNRAKPAGAAFCNSIFEHLWTRQHIDHIEICATEAIGVGERGGFYEEAGIFRDMVQNHLLELVSLIAMEPPLSFKADDVRDKKLEVLRACAR